LGLAAAYVVALLLGCPAQPRPAAALYREYCARCHGDDGRGDPRSVGLYPDLNLTTAIPVRLQAKGVLYTRIAQGYGAMPGFSQHLAQEEIQELVEFTMNFAETRRGR
jgi:mono/diheme cytochrome c family protein